MNQNLPVRRACTVALAGAVALPLMATPAAASGEELGGKGATYYLNNQLTGEGAKVVYGSETDRTYVGDWDGDGVDSFAVRRGFTYHLSNGHSGKAEQVVPYGKADDVTLTGDWDGDGKDTFAVRRGNLYHIHNGLNGGRAEQVVVYGKASDQVVVGDWNGDGKDTLAVRRGNEFHIKETIGDGPADYVVTVAGASSRAIAVAGDWDGNGADSVGVREGNTAILRHTGGATQTVQYGRAGDQLFTGDWNGDGTDTLGARRPAAAPAAAPSTSRPATSVSQTSAGAVVLEAARSRIGGRYVFGGSGPTSFDCSGLTSWAYKAAGVSLPHQSGGQRSFGQNYGKRVSLSQAKPGDLVWWPGHVAIYAGNGRIVDAANPSTGITERRIYGSPEIYRIV